MTDFVPNRPGHTASLLTDSPKNLILIVAESLSTRWVETYGCPLPTTPNLRRLADRSLTFENFYATANYSLASALPILAGVYNEPTVFSTPLNWPGFPMPAAARWLRAHGYRTYFLGSGGEPVWAYYEMGALFGTDGFDVGRNPRARFWQSATDPQAFLSRKYRDPDLFADARRVVGEERGNRFALFLWAYDTHALYAEGDGPDDWRVEHFPLAVRGHPEWEPRFRRYLRAVWRLDKLVGELCAELEVLGLAEDTLIVLTGDHGEAFGEHGRFFHEWFVYEEEVRVPLILINPRLAPLGKRSPVLGSHIDLWATITDICALPADPHWQGRSLVGGTAEDRRAYFQALAGPVGLREGRWKYIWDTREACHVLFDLDTDPHERNNIAADHPQRCAEMYHRVATWVIYQRQLSQRMLTNERH